MMIKTFCKHFQYDTINTFIDLLSLKCNYFLLCFSKTLAI